MLSGPLPSRSVLLGLGHPEEVERRQDDLHQEVVVHAVVDGRGRRRRLVELLPVHVDGDGGAVRLVGRLGERGRSWNGRFRSAGKKRTKNIRFGAPTHVRFPNILRASCPLSLPFLPLRDP